MRNYSEYEVFSGKELAYFLAAQELIQLIPDDFMAEGWDLRCHEVTRAVGAQIGLKVVDGKSGRVDHSWLLTVDNPRSNILDVYVVGRLPQVQLVDMKYIGPRHDLVYVPGKDRTDIDGAVVEKLLQFFGTKHFGV